MVIIGLGHKARQGKNYVANFMKEYDPRVKFYAFADQLKDQVIGAFSLPQHPYWQFLNETRHPSISKAIARIKVTDNSCWAWTGKMNDLGYGILYTPEQENYRATRFIWKEVLGLELPEALLHLCDNTSCVNPLHLIPGSKADNSRDMVLKERSANGERHSQVALTDHEVKQIRLLYAQGKKQVDICKALELNSSTVSRIVNNLTRLKETTSISKVKLQIDFKENWLSDNNKFRFTPLLQNYGTEFARAQNENYWVEALNTRILNDDPEVAVVTDVRFQNEAEYIKEKGGYLVEVIRLNEDGTQFVDPGRDPKHPSETALDDYEGWDYAILCKDGDLENLKRKSIGVLNAISFEDFRPPNQDLELHFVDEGGVFDDSVYLHPEWADNQGDGFID